MTSWTDFLAGDAPANEPPARPASQPVPRSGGTTPYGRAALETEAAELRATKEGERNNRLNRAAFAAGQLIAGGELDEREAREVLTEAARAAGLGAREIAATLDSGIGSGKEQPRTAPPREERVNGHPKGGNGKRPEEPKDTGPKFEIIDSDAIFAELEEPEYLIDQIARRGSLIEIVSYGGSGKSWLAVDMLIAVASGQPWLGRFPTKQGKVLGLDYENGSYEMRRRIQAVARARGLELPVNGIGLASMPAVYMSDIGEFGAAIADVAKDCSLIVIDTLKAASPGIDENDSNIRVGLDHLRRVGEQTGCTFVVLVHGKKTSGSVSPIDPREQGRGSSAIYDAADAVFHIAYVEGEPLRVRQTKARMGRIVEPFQVSIADTDDGVLVAASDMPRGGPDGFETLCSAVLDVVRAHPGESGRVIREHVKGARAASVVAALEYLERHGAIRNTGTDRRAKWEPTGKGAPGAADDEWSEFDA